MNKIEFKIIKGNERSEEINEILNEEAAKDELFKEILTSQRIFLTKAREWSKISEFSYIQKTSK